MGDDKAVKIGISLPGTLLAAIDLDLAGKQSRSGFFKAAAEIDLRRRGKYLPDPIAAELARARELIEARGVQVVRAKLDELTNETVVTEGTRT